MSSIPDMVNEFQTGRAAGRPKASRPTTDADLSRIRRSDHRLHAGPALSGAEHPTTRSRACCSGCNVTGADPVDFTYDNRLGNTAQDYLSQRPRQRHLDARDATRSRCGGYLEYMQNNEARGGNWMGQYPVHAATPPTRSTPDFAYSNALLGRLSAVHRNRCRPSDAQPGMDVRVLRAGHLAARRARLTLDYGARFLCYAPVRRRWTIRSRTSIRRRFDPAKRAASVPAGDRQRGARRVRSGDRARCRLNADFIGAYVPGTGDPNNGMVDAGDGRAARVP